MNRPLPMIHEDVETLRAQLRQERNLERKRRLHLLVLVAGGEVRTRLEAAEHLAVHRITLGRWLNRYEQEGLEGLLRQEERGARAGQRTISSQAFEALAAQLGEAEGFGSYGEIQHWLAEQWGEEVNYSGVYRLVHRHLKAKLKRPRPCRPKKTMPNRPLSRNA